MPHFVYEAKSSGQKTIQGEIEALSRQDALVKLGRMGYYPLNLENKSSGQTPGASRFTIPFAKKWSLADLSDLFRQISDLMNAGISLPMALKMVSDQTRAPHLKKNLEALAREVQGGRSLSSAMELEPAIFTPFYVKLIQAGEAGGMLGRTLERLADITEKEEDARSQVRAALAYPAFIFLVGILTVVFLLAVIVPKIAAMFSEFRENLPLPTKVLLMLSDGSKWIFPLLFAAGAGIYFLTRRAEARRKIKAVWDRASLKIPYFKSWVTNRESGQFVRTLGLLLQSGVPLPQSVGIAYHTVRHHSFQSGLASMESEVRQGMALSRCLKKSGIFSDSICNLAAVAEQGGRLGDALVKISDALDRKAERELKVMVSLLEPLMILVIGAVLGSVVLSIMLPLFDINTFIR